MDISISEPNSKLEPKTDLLNFLTAVQVGPSLGMRKSSSLESLQTAIQETQRNPRNEPIYARAHPRKCLLIIYFCFTICTADYKCFHSYVYSIRKYYGLT